jgi:tRNA modification GTPase
MVDTIIAQATPDGESALAVLRLSGPLCTEILESSCGVKNCIPRKANLADYLDVNGNRLDQILITFFKNGNSYTGQDLIEISCHGNPLIAELICEDLLNRGCRLAKPGEFTKLAFLNGKIDLSQAESVAQIISAKTQQSLKAAQRNLKGELSRVLEGIQDNILILQAILEASIDFPEDDIETNHSATQNEVFDKIKFDLEELLKHASRTNILERNLRVVLTGFPNAGKSSLFNEMLGRSRSLVHNEAGTTRDYLESDLKIGKTTITLVDTAGVRDSNSDIEQRGVKLAHEQIEHSDIVIWVVDNSAPYPSTDIKTFIELLRNKPSILVLNKNDLQTTEWMPKDVDLPKINVSCTNKDGIEEVIQMIGTHIKKLTGDSDEKALYIGKRHNQLIGLCLEEINQFQESESKGIGYEIISSYLTSAREYIDEMIGLKTNENMLDKLFGQFCIGK